MLDRIEIKEVAIAKQEGTYVIEALWRAITEGGAYSGPYKLALLKSGAEETIWDVGSGCSCVQTVDVEIEKGEDYAVKVGGVTGSEIVYSETMAVLFHSFDAVNGNFDGKTLHLHWQERDDISFGRALAPDGGLIIGEYGDNFLNVPICMDLIKTGKTAALRLTPYREEHSSGPAVEFPLYPCSARLDAIEEVGEEGEKTSVAILQSHEYEDSSLSALQLELVLYYGKQEWASSKAAGAKSGSKIVFSFEQSQVPAEALTRARAVLFTGSSQTFGDTAISLTGRGAASEEIPLGTAGEIRVSAGADNAEISWSYEGEMPPSHYLISGSDQKSCLVCGEKTRIAYEGNYSKTCVVRPYYGARAGRRTTENALFLPGFFVYKKGAGYCIALGTDRPYAQTLSLTIKDEIYSEHLAVAVEGKGLKLEPAETGYVLTVANPQERTCEDYESFLSALCQVDRPQEGKTDVISLLPEFLGWIQRLLAEMSECALQELLQLACGYSTRDRCVDLKQGMGLMVESEGYKPNVALGNQTEAGEYLPGYYLAGSVLYQIHTYGEQKEWKLGFEPFLAGMRESVQLRSGRLTRENGMGGLADLLCEAFRKPYYRLHYPLHTLDSQNAGSDYAPSNVCLIGASAYGQLVEATRQMNQEETVKDPGVALAYFRGRAAMIAKITVYVNGAVKQVSVGTTLGHILEQEGAAVNPAFGGLKMLRRSAFFQQAYLPVHFSDTEEGGWLELPLFNGDRILLD